MSNHKRNWILIWTAIGAISAGVLAIPPLIEGARSVIVGSLSDKVNRIEQDVKEVKGDVKLIMMHQGIAEVAKTNNIANGNRQTKKNKYEVFNTAAVLVLVEYHASTRLFLRVQQERFH